MKNLHSQAVGKVDCKIQIQINVQLKYLRSTSVRYEH